MLYRLDEVRHSKEEKPARKTFVQLDGNEIGFDLDWETEMVAFRIFKQKKKNTILEGSPISLYAGEDALCSNLKHLVSEYYRMTGRDPELKMYTIIELSIQISHLNYHVYAGTLRRVLEKEIIYF